MTAEAPLSHSHLTVSRDRNTNMYFPCSPFKIKENMSREGKGRRKQDGTGKLLSKGEAVLAGLHLQPDSMGCPGA